MIRLFKQYPHWLFFGLLCTAFSGPGQTYLISLLIPAMRESFDLSSTMMGSLYAAATLLSGFLLPYFGRQLDRISLLSFTQLIGLFLAIGCFILAFSQVIFFIFIGFVLIRLTGQGTLMLISGTTMSRHFGSYRGKALGIAGLGNPLGEAIFPICISFVLAHYGWRAGWGTLGCSVLFLFLPAVWLFLRNQPAPQISDLHDDDHEPKSSKNWTVRDIFKDPRIYFFLFPALIPPFFMTALFFHQGTLIAEKGWSIQLIASAFIAFAIARAASSLLIGPLIDRFSAVRLFTGHLIPLGLGISCLAWGGLSTHWAFLYLGLAGVTVGMGANVKSALLAEIYGVKHLGAIRGTLGTFMVLSTAISPPLIGWLLDHGISHGDIYTVLLIILTGSIVSGWIATQIHLKQSNTAVPIQEASQELSS